MRKIALIAFFCAGFVGFSQSITLARLNGTPINNGDVLAVSQAGYPQGEIGFKVRNVGTTTTNVWVRCDNLVNTDGTNFEFCFGEECLADVIVGQVYPSVGVTLAPNGANGNYDHFLNNNTSGTGFPLDYTFTFFQTGQATQGGTPVGNSITVTYRFDPNLSVDEINQLETSGVILKSTLVNNELVFDVLKKTNMTVFDINGKQVMESVLEYGMQTFDVSALNSGVYMVYFTNESGAATVKKFIKN